MADPNLELRRGRGEEPVFDLPALLAFLPSVISSFLLFLDYYWQLIPFIHTSVSISMHAVAPCRTGGFALFKELIYNLCN